LVGWLALRFWSGLGMFLPWAWSGFFSAEHQLIFLAGGQARNQPGTPGGVKSFLRGAQIF